MIKDYIKPFILWASPRTASSAFFYEYAKRNNVKIIKSDHEPLNPPIEVNIKDLFRKQISFKFMFSGYVHTAKEQWEIKELYNIFPALDYNHILIYRKDVYARHKSLLFAVTTDIWHPTHFSESKCKNWSTPNQTFANHRDATGKLKQSLDKSIELIDIFEKENLNYQIVEFEDVCKYIGKDTSQGTNHYYNDYEDFELKQKLEDIFYGHEFYKRL
jgi:hypothetical protein